MDHQSAENAPVLYCTYEKSTNRCNTEIYCSFSLKPDQLLVLILYIYVRGNLLWTEIFFSTYRPSCLIESYGSPGGYWLVCVRLLAAHLLNLNFIFLSDNLTVTAECAAGLADVSCC